jgi:ketosteroid isomerase-like protein
MAAMMLTSTAMAPAALPVDSDNADVTEIAARWAEAFNQGSFESDSAPCAENAVVIDDPPPYVWQGSGACSRWYKTVKAWAEGAAVTRLTIKIGNTSHLEAGADHAYLVAPVTLSYVKAGKAVDFPGTLAMTLKKDASGWRVSGAAWVDK